MNRNPAVPELTKLEKIEFLTAELDVLISENEEAGHRCSIYLPTGVVRNEISESRLHFNRAVGDMAKVAGAAGWGEIESSIERHLGYWGQEESELSDFWQNQSGGLAVFVDESSARIVQVPKAFTPNAFLSSRWYLTPLMELAANADCFWVLSLSLNEVSLFRGSRLGFREVGFGEGSHSFEDSATALHRSSGDDPELIDARPDKENLKHWFEEIDGLLQPVLGNDTSPLLLAGVDYYLPLFREVCHYPHLSQSVLSGNPEHLEKATLHEKAAEILSPEFEDSRKRELMRIRTLAGGDLVESELAGVLAAAWEGRVGALVAPSDGICWGRYDFSAPNTVTRLELHDPNGMDLYQLAAERVLQMGGEVFYLESARMPLGRLICAELRY